MARCRCIVRTIVSACHRRLDRGFKNRTRIFSRQSGQLPVLHASNPQQKRNVVIADVKIAARSTRANNGSRSRRDEVIISASPVSATISARPIERVVWIDRQVLEGRRHCEVLPQKSKSRCPCSVIHLARAKWLSQARRARSGSSDGSICSTIRATSAQSAPSASASSRRI